MRSVLAGRRDRALSGPRSSTLVINPGAADVDGQGRVDTGTMAMAAPNPILPARQRTPPDRPVPTTIRTTAPPCAISNITSAPSGSRQGRCGAMWTVRPNDASSNETYSMNDRSPTIGPPRRQRLRQRDPAQCCHLRPLDARGVLDRAAAGRYWPGPKVRSPARRRPAPKPGTRRPFVPEQRHLRNLPDPSLPEVEKPL